MFRGLLACLLVTLLVNSVVAVEPVKHVEVIIFLVDRSGSMNQLPEPDTTQAALTEAIQVAILSGRPVRIAIILFNGNGVKILGDDKDMPTSAMKTLHKRLMNEWEAPLGGTPLDEALQQCVRMVKDLPSSYRCTVVNIGDGHPASGRLRADDFSEIQDEMDRQLKAIHAQPYPPAIIQNLVDQRKAAWGNPMTEEFTKLYELQLKAEFDACLAHAAALKGRQVRFVSLDFAGGINELRQIHDAAGGTDDDYANVSPANTVVKQTHQLGLTQLQGIIVPKPVLFAAESSLFERQTSHMLDSVGEAAVVTFVFHSPIPRFDDQVKFTIDVGGATHTFSEQNHDPDAIVNFDAAGNVASATLFLPSLEGIRDMNIRFDSPRQSIHPPEMTLYSHLRVAPDMIVVSHPVHRTSDDPLPFAVSSQLSVEWVFGLRNQGEPQFLPLQGVEPIWRRNSDGHEIRIDTKPDTGSPGLFRSSSQMRLPPGCYDLEVNCILESGAQIRLKVPRHVQSQRKDEHLTIEYDPSSKSEAFLDLGEMGDELHDGTIDINLRAANVDYPIPVAVAVVGLSDSLGNTPQEPWIVPTRKTIQLFPGRSQKMTLRWQLPERIERTLADGVFTGELQFRRLDTNEILDVRPFDPNLENGIHPVTHVQFVLHRPNLVVRAPRAFHNAIEQTKSGSHRLRLSFDVSVPFERIVRIKVNNPSKNPRDVSSDLTTPFRDKVGRSIRGLEISLADGCEAIQTADPYETVTFKYLLKAEDVEELRSGDARLIISSPGMHGVSIDLNAQVRNPFLGWWIRIMLYVFALFISVSLGMCVYSWRQAMPYCTEREIVCSPSCECEQFQVERATKGQVLLIPNTPLSIKQHDEKRERPFNGKIRIQPDDVTEEKPLMIMEKLPDGERTALAFRQILIDEEGKPELHGHVIDGGRFDQLAATLKTKLIRRSLAFTALLCSAVFLFIPPFLNVAQWVCDLFSL